MLQFIEKASFKSDILGVMASGLCAVHCAATPLFFAAKPALEMSCSSSGHCGGCWGSLDYVFLVLSAGAVWFSARHTTLQWVKLLLWIGWGLFAIGLSMEFFVIPFGKELMYTGSAALISTHFYNMRYCKTCNTDQCV